MCGIEHRFDPIPVVRPCYDERMSVQVREVMAEALMALSAALSYAESATVIDGTFPAFMGNSTRQQPSKHWLRSVPLQMSDAKQGKRPGTEVRASECDTPHYNFIAAGRNV